MGEKQQENKGRKTEKNKEKKIELEKDEMEFHKSKKKDKVVSKDAISDDVVGALKIAGVEGEENTNARSNGRKDSVDDSEERKEKKKKRKEKKKKEGVDGTSSEVENSEAEKRDELVKGYKNRGGVPVENGEEERAKKNKKKKKEKEGSDNEVKNSMTNEETLSKERNHLDGKIKEHGKLAVKEKNLDKIRDNVQKGAENGDVAEVSNDKDGGKSKKKKKKKKIREREDAYDEVEDEMEVDEEGDKSKMKKKRKMENDDEMKTNEEGDRIKKKEGKRDSVSGEVENEMKTNEEREESKKKKERKKENSSAEVEDEMQTNEEGEKSKKKERKRENASNEVENNMKTNEEGEKSKKKKRSKKEIVSDDVEDQMKTDEEVDKSKKTRKRREYVSADVEDKPEIDERDNSKKNKKRKREIVSGDVEDKSDELGKGDGGSKDKKKKGKAEKQVSSGEAHKGKAIIEKDIEDADTFENPTPQGKSKRVSFSDHVEVFLDDSPSGGGPSGGESISDQGEGLVHGKWFTPKEDDLLQKAVLGYIEDHNLGDDGLHMILNCMSYPQVRGCWKEISAALPWRPILSVYYRGHILFERDEKRKWTAEEYEYIRDFVNEHGADWKTLSTELKKHRFHCKDTWRRIKQINLKKGCWSQEEYQTLFDLVNMDLHMRALEERKSKHGMLRDNICWGAISDRLTTRSDATCCTKWYSQLTSPMVQQGLWSDTDDYRLLNALSSVDAPCLEDVDWDNLLDHRDGDMCRKRWNQMVKHIGEYGLKTFSEQVEVLANRYSPDCIEAREEFDSKPILP